MSSDQLVRFWVHHLCIRTNGVKSIYCESFNFLFLDQRTPLHLAAEKGRFENILGYLLGKGAGINIKDNEGVTIHVTIN